jgi:hypothetical protein
MSLPDEPQRRATLGAQPVEERHSVLTVRFSPTHESRLGKRFKASWRSSSVVESRGV